MCGNDIPNVHCTSEMILCEQYYTEYENPIHMGTKERHITVTSAELPELKESLIQLNFIESKSWIERNGIPLILPQILVLSYF